MTLHHFFFPSLFLDSEGQGDFQFEREMDLVENKGMILLKSGVVRERGREGGRRVAGRTLAFDLMLQCTLRI